ncbi:MAG: thymidine phosphorylase, partial [Rubrivivax sp.]
MNGDTLSIRRVGIDTWRESVVFLHRDCPVVRAAGFQALAKVRVQANGKTLIGVLNVVDDAGICEPLE